MPQMMPLNWLSMFICLNTIMITFMIINFNIFIPTSPKIDSSKVEYNIYKWTW